MKWRPDKWKKDSFIRGNRLTPIRNSWWSEFLDKLALGQLITEIRGERTMAQLAEQCNVSPSTLSRAVNGKMTKPLSQELIKALAAKSDDPFMLERLVRANGMADAKTCEERKQMAHDNLSLREERLNTERKSQKYHLDRTSEKG